MSTRKLVIGAVTAILAGTAVWLTRGDLDGPGTRSSGKPTTADYCNVLLVPSLAEHLHLDLPLRIAAARKGARLLHDLRHGSGRTPLQALSGTVSEELGTRTLKNFGVAMRDLLPLDALRAFERIFAEGQLVRVGFLLEDEDDGGGPRRFLVTYGWYEEERSRSALKSLADLEKQLNECWRWIPSEYEAEDLLDHDDEDVRSAADAFFEHAEEAFEAPPARGPRSPRLRARVDVPPTPAPRLEDPAFEAAKERFDRDREAAQQEIEESRRAMAERAAERAAEREAFRERVRAKLEAAKERAAQRRGEER